MRLIAWQNGVLISERIMNDYLNLKIYFKNLPLLGLCRVHNVKHKIATPTAKEDPLPSARLFQHAIALVLVVQFEHLWCLIVFDAFTIKKETKRRKLDSLSVGISLEHLAHFGGLLDLEKSFFSGLCRHPAIAARRAEIRRQALRQIKSQK